MVSWSKAVISRFQLVCSYLSEMMVLGQVSVGESVPDLDTASETPLSAQAIFVSMITLLVLCIFTAIFVDLSFTSSNSNI